MLYSMSKGVYSFKWSCSDKNETGEIATLVNPPDHRCHRLRAEGWRLWCLLRINSITATNVGHSTICEDAR